MKIIEIDKLEGIKEESPGYVIQQLVERIKDIRTLPDEVKKIISKSKKGVIDVGPGEGVSSMAIASVFENIKITGIEMDKKHLVGAWPLCRDYSNLELFWGALPGTPSNSKVDGNISIPQLDKEERCSVLFSWTGISRADIFESNKSWIDTVEDVCIFVVPRFWREGTDYLGKDLVEIKNLCEKNGVELKEWSEQTSIPGFSKMEIYPLENSLKARGWILWLSGIFDSMEVSFWDTLKDRWKDDPSYQLSEISLDLEIIVMKK